jgi:hypothetical protein
VRSGTITAAGLTYTVTQNPPCRYAIDADGSSFTSAGGSGSIGVTAGDGCDWSASSNRTWIQITAGTSGSGDGSVSYTVGTYTGATVRSGTITVAGLTHSVTQGPAPRHEVTNIVMTPSSPASLVFSDEVNITFDYHTDEDDGVRIFARPYSDGSPTPNYAVHGSDVYPAGDGSGTGWFTILSGGVTVDQVRVFINNADFTELLFETYIDVSYDFIPSTSDVAGTWSVEYDWDCAGSPRSTTFYIASDGSFTTSGGYSGRWSLNGSEITLSIAQTNRTVYTGTVSGDRMVDGTMVNDANMTGCWTATRADTAVSFKAGINSGESSVDEDGNPLSP